MGHENVDVQGLHSTRMLSMLRPPWLAVDPTAHLAASSSGAACLAASFAELAASLVPSTASPAALPAPCTRSEALCLQEARKSESYGAVSRTGESTGLGAIRVVSGHWRSKPQGVHLQWCKSVCGANTNPCVKHLEGRASQPGSTAALTRDKVSQLPIAHFLATVLEESPSPGLICQVRSPVSHLCGRLGRVGPVGARLRQGQGGRGQWKSRGWEACCEGG